MLIASWPLHDFAGFLQIISWITLPVLAVAVLSTYFLHLYQKKKKNEPGREEGEEEVTPAPRKNDSVHQARYRALKRDFVTLQRSYDLNVGELSLLQSEVRRQDFVIERLREDVVQLEKKLSNLNLALTLKDEQLNSIRSLEAAVIT
jgi:hypothetical protein